MLLTAEVSNVDIQSIIAGVDGATVTSGVPLEVPVSAAV
ncbi:MAG: hypothetical protein JWN41_230, partial [Thermoleophilia bacterium]|nr:hypothetical protein [Thermoleophilia bacterium]